MLFVIEYELNWESLDAVIAKRLELEQALPDRFHFVGEYIWQDRDPPFRGVAIVETDEAEALNAFVLHYGPSLKMQIHPATDVAAATSSADIRNRAAKAVVKAPPKAKRSGRTKR